MQIMKKNKPTLKNFKYTEQIKRVFERFRKFPNERSLKRIINAMPKNGMFLNPEYMKGKDLILKGEVTDSFGKKIEHDLEYVEFVPKFYKVADNLRDVFKTDGSDGVAHWLINYIEHTMNMQKDSPIMLNKTNKEFIIMPKKAGDARIGADVIAQQTTQKEQAKVINLDKPQLN